ncbi:glycosyltransferase family 2 protein [Natronococcus roseus]|uniref:glycosyltransferase family 2 protein n=1 Tax=Natronococcus roseus TaxID=1052014 RepID=UPI00374DE874
MPKVSVIIPTYNRGDVLSRAISSVLNQSFKDFNLIIVDTGSSDNTETIMSEFSDDRIIYHRIEMRKSASEARNIGIKLSKSPYVSFLDSDDEIKENHIEAVVEELEQESQNCVGAFTGREIRVQGDMEYTQPIDKEYIKYSDILKRNSIGGFSNLTFRRSVFSSDNYIDESMNVFEDYDLLLRVLKDGFKFKGIDENLTIRYKDNDDRLSDKPNDITNGRKKLFEKHGKDLSSKAKSRLYYIDAQYQALGGNLRTARKYYSKSIYYDYTKWFSYLHLIATIHPYLFHSLIECKRTIKKIADWRKYKNNLKKTIN